MDEVSTSKNFWMPRSSPGLYAKAGLTVAVCTAVCKTMQGLDHSNLIMVYLLGVVWCASRYGRGPSVLASILSVGGFDYFFVRPYYSLTVDDSQYLLTFAVMLVVAVLISTLTTRARDLALAGSKLAEQAEFERLRNILLSSVSHDVRTPLSTITGAASTLMSSDNITTLPREKELATAIYEEAERLESYVKNVLSMTRLQAGAIQMNLELQPLEEVVGAALSRMEERLSNRNIVTDLEPNLPLLNLDAVLMEQVFLNLLDNAAKHTTEGDTITISAKHSDGDVVISVGDTGKGIEPQDAERVFEKFFRSKDTEGTTAGAGLGLAICRAIINEHGGRIWAETSGTTRGACLMFKLPAAIKSETSLHGK